MAATFKDRRVAVFMRYRMSLWYRVQVEPGSPQWTPWTDLGSPPGSGGISSDPVVTAPVHAYESLKLFVSTRRGIGYLRESASGTIEPQPWQSIPAPPGGPPLGSPAFNSLGRLTVASVTPDGMAWQVQQQCVSCDDWPDWVLLAAPAPSGGAPPALHIRSLRYLGEPGAAGQGAVVFLIAATDAGNVWEISQSLPSGAQRDWTALGRPNPNGAVGRPAVVHEPGGNPLVFVSKADGAIWYKRRQVPASFTVRRAWSAWHRLGRPPTADALDTDIVAAMGPDNRIDVFVWAGRTLWAATQRAPGSDDWLPWVSMSEYPYANNPSLGHSGEIKVCGGQLFLRRGGDSVWRASRTGDGPWWGFQIVTIAPAPGTPSFTFLDVACLNGRPYALGESRVWQLNFAAQWETVRRPNGAPVLARNAQVLAAGTDASGGPRLLAYGRDGLVDLKLNSLINCENDIANFLPVCPVQPAVSETLPWLVTTPPGPGAFTLMTGSRNGIANGPLQLFVQVEVSGNLPGWRPLVNFTDPGFEMPALGFDLTGRPEVYFSDIRSGDGNVLVAIVATI